MSELTGVMRRPLRQSIEPTYDSTKTGPRYHVSTFVDDRVVAFQEPLSDPFVLHRVTVGWRDLLRGLLLRRRLEVTVNIGGDRQMVEDVLELDGDYLGTNCTRRDEFDVALGASLSTFAASEESGE